MLSMSEGLYEVLKEQWLLCWKGGGTVQHDYLIPLIFLMIKLGFNMLLCDWFGLIL